MSDGPLASRLFGALLRAYPPRARERFGDAIRYGWTADLEAARAAGPGATIAFWTTTVIDAARFGLAERTSGITARGIFTVDWRDAWRSLRAAPLVSGFAVLSLALGIGGVTALFSILNSLALKPLPVRDPPSLVLLDKGSWTNPIWEAVRDRQTAFAGSAFGWAADRFNLAPSGAADIVQGLWVSGSMFDVLGVTTVLGRAISPADDVRGGGPQGPVAVISHRMWQRRFGGAPNVIGQRLQIERVPFTIIGVTAPDFFGPDTGRWFDVAIPLGTEPLVRPRDSALDHRTSWWMNIMARLRPGQTPQQATALLRAIQPQIRDATLPTAGTPDEHARYLSDPFTLVAAPGGRSLLRSRYERPLTTILGVVGLVLLIACANIANLLLARASTRRHELTVRLALGASRFRIAKQLLAESLVLAAAGAALGVWFARWGSALLVSQLTTYSVAIDLDLDLDWRVLGFATAVSAAAALLSGVAPALSVGGIAPHDALKEHGRVVIGGRRIGLRQASVVVQVAMSLTLVVTAGLLTRSFVRLATRDAGFDRHGVLVVGARVDRNAIAGEPARLALFERFTRAVSAVPGVASAAASYTTPTASAGWNTEVSVPAGSPLTRRQRTSWVNIVSPGWFGTIGLPLVAGRDFDDRDRAGAPPVAIVNRTFERRFLQGKPTPGSIVTLAERGAAGPRYEVVGVVEDIVYRSLRSPMEPIMYFPLAQGEDVGMSIVISVRAASGPPQNLAHSVAAAITREDPSAVLSVRTLEDQVDASLTQERIVATLAGFFGVLGLLLAALGLYGVTSYAVMSRRSEIGIRMALGASADGVVRMVLRRVARLVGAGIVAGAGLSMWAVTFTRTLLYDMDPRDPLTFAGATLILIVVATIAAWLPARRASRIDPVQVLRQV